MNDAGVKLWTVFVIVALFSAESPGFAPCPPGFREAALLPPGSVIPPDFVSFINDYEVYLTCDLTLEPGDRLRKRIYLQGSEASGVVVDCNGAWIEGLEGTPIFDTDMIIIASVEDPGSSDPADPDGVLPTFTPPTDITIRECNIFGSVRIRGMGNNGENHHIRRSSHIDAYHPLRVRLAAPTRILLDELLIVGAEERNPLYLAPGVTHVTFKNSEIRGSSSRTGLYLDAESAYNTIRNNFFHVNVSDWLDFREGPQINIDGSSHNRIINNTFSSIHGGGSIKSYRNCGEGGTIRHSTPSFNEIINNVFYPASPFSYGGYDVEIGSRGDEWWRIYCDDDEQHCVRQNPLDPFSPIICNPWPPNMFFGGSYADNHSFSRCNVVMQNQFHYFGLGHTIRQGDSTNRPNYIANNTIFVDENTLVSRQAGCYLPSNNPSFNFALDGESAELYDLFDTSIGLVTCFGRRATCSDGDWMETEGLPCDLMEVEFECQQTESNAECEGVATCPAGWRVVGAKAACNLEFGTISDAELGVAPLNSIQVVVPSDEVDKGYCSVGHKRVSVDSLEIREIGGLRSVPITCKEDDDNGGECHIRGILYCRPVTTQDLLFSRACKADEDCNDSNDCTTEVCNTDELECEYNCMDEDPPTPVGGCPPELVTLECGVDTDPGFNPIFEDSCDDELELSAISGIRLSDCPQESFTDRSLLARDDCDNLARCDQTLAVVDTTAPDVMCPAQIVVRCTSPEGAWVADVPIMASATDICDVEVSVTDNRPVEFYPPSCPNDRPTIVTFRSTDDCGNEGTCQTRVYVYGPMCCPGYADGELTLLPADVDLRQETTGPTITKGNFDIWNQDERRFSGLHRCVNCWDQTLLSVYDTPNYFLRGVLHTDKGKARVDGLSSQVCPGSVESPMVGVFTKEITFPGRINEVLRSVITPVASGGESAKIFYDVIAGPKDAREGTEPRSRETMKRGIGLDSARLESRGSEAEMFGGVAGINPGGRGDVTRKGSLIIWPRVEIRWNAEHELIEDTFLTLTNDDPSPVDVQLYLVNGDPPLEPQCDPICQANFGGVCSEGPCLTERPHPGWNKSDVQLTLTANQPTYWSAATGQPAGVSSFDILDPAGLLAIGRPDLDPRNPGGRVIRGFVMGWAVNADGKEIHWNHLTGNAMILHYLDSSAAEYNAWAFQCVANVAQGEEPDALFGQLNLNGLEYEYAPDALLFDFYAVGSTALSHPSVR